MEYTIVNCVNCSEQFERPKKRGRPQTKCEACRGPSQLVKENISAVVDGVVMVENVEPCRDCGQVFMRAKKRGKPPVRCADCREKNEQIKALEVTTSPETIESLFSGDRFLLQGTPNEVPKGAEAQCPRPRGCGRLFTSNTACDRHKVFGSNGNIERCLDPASLGMEPRERRGLPVWTTPSEVK